MAAEDNLGGVERDNSDQSQPCDRSPAGGADCGSASSGGECCPSGPGRGKNFKIAIFVLVVLLAGAVTAHSLLMKNRPCSPGNCGPGDAVSSCCPGDGSAWSNPQCPGNAKTSAGKSCPSKKTCPSGNTQTSSSPCCPGSAKPAQSEGKTN